MSVCLRTSAPSPFVKWAGGKRSLLRELVGRLPCRFGDYYEPFVGGAALFLSIGDRIGRAVLSDSNAELVTTYNVIRHDPVALIRALEEHACCHSEEHYYQVRGWAKLGGDDVAVAARFIYLNKTCYNGLYRVNKGGEFNVPVGRYSNPNICDRSNIMAVHEVLQSVSIECCDFEHISPREGDFVYCDPPYHPVNPVSSFTKYTQGGFTEADQVRLRDFVVSLRDKGVFVMVSNSDTPFTRDLYSDPCFDVRAVRAPRFVNCKSGGRGSISELLVTGYW